MKYNRETVKASIRLLAAVLMTGVAVYALFVLSSAPPPRRAEPYNLGLAAYVVIPSGTTGQIRIVRPPREPSMNAISQALSEAMSENVLGPGKVVLNWDKEMVIGNPYTITLRVAVRDIDNLKARNLSTTLRHLPA